MRKVIGFLKKILMSNNSTLVDRVVTTRMKIERLHMASKLNDRKIICDNEGSDEPDVIVSLTSYNKRIKDVYLVVESIAEQTIKPNRVILWLDESEFRDDNLPLSIISLVSRGLEVKYTNNIKSYKKMIPSLSLFKEDIIVTVDDDIIYPHDFLEELLREYENYPNCIIGHRAHKIKFDNEGDVLTYKKWVINTIDSEPSNSIFITTGGGTLIPPGLLKEEVTNSSVFMSLAPNADDVWLKSMALFSNVKCKRVANNTNWDSRFFVIPDGQDISLYLDNLVDNGNDRQLSKLFDYYDLEITTD